MPLDHSILSGLHEFPFMSLHQNVLGHMKSPLHILTPECPWPYKVPLSYPYIRMSLAICCPLSYPYTRMSLAIWSPPFISLHQNALGHMKSPLHIPTPECPWQYEVPPSYPYTRMSLAIWSPPFISLHQNVLGNMKSPLHTPTLECPRLDEIPLYIPTPCSIHYWKNSPIIPRADTILIKY